MRIYAAIIFGLCLILTGCPDKPEKGDDTMSMEESSTTTSEIAIPEQSEGMENMEGEEKMEEATEQADTQ